MIEVLKAPPFATVQDQGWSLGRAIGMPQGGAMDPALLARVNRALGNDSGAAGIEWALGAGILRCNAEATLCVTFGSGVTLNGIPQHRPVFEVLAGSVVELVPQGEDRFTYIGVRGGIAVPAVLGSRSTYLPGGFGGLSGRRLTFGDRLPIGTTAGLKSASRLNLPLTRDPGAPVVLRVMIGPQWDHFDSSARDRFLESVYQVSGSADRMGYRLSGPAVPPRDPATLPSEPACPGAVQVPDGGEPIVLMPDGPTVGGYPKLAVVLAEDLPRLAQCGPGRVVRFRMV